MQSHHHCEESAGPTLRGSLASNVFQQLGGIMPSHTSSFHRGRAYTGQVHTAQGLLFFFSSWEDMSFFLSGHKNEDFAPPSLSSIKKKQTHLLTSAVSSGRYLWILSFWFDTFWVTLQGVMQLIWREPGSELQVSFECISATDHLWVLWPTHLLQPSPNFSSVKPVAFTVVDHEIFAYDYIRIEFSL